MPTIVANFVSSISTKKKGDFSSKMWSSYTQLNPGVYSEAIATEFKNRMKPTYVDSAGTGYYYNTFGPPGLNKKTADWIYMLTTGGNVLNRTISKSGAIMKWNLDGTVLTQNNLPAYTKGVNAGIITFTSTDGFGGVTYVDLLTNPFNGVCPTFVFINTTRLAISGTPNFTGVLPNFNAPKIVDFFAQDSKFSSVVSIAGFATNNVSQFALTNNTFNTANVDYVLAYFNSMFALTIPKKNMTLNLSGATMGIPTGAGSNTDLLGILAKFTAAGFTATIIVRTV
jgi:hypothetical protein